MSKLKVIVVDSSEPSGQTTRHIVYAAKSELGREWYESFCFGEGHNKADRGWIEECLPVPREEGLAFVKKVQPYYDSTDRLTLVDSLDGLDMSPPKNLLVEDQLHLTDYHPEEGQVDNSQPADTAKDEFIRKVYESESMPNGLREEAARLLGPRPTNNKLDLLKKQNLSLIGQAKCLSEHQVNEILEAVAGQWDGIIPTGGVVSSHGVYTYYGVYRVDVSKGKVAIT